MRVWQPGTHLTMSRGAKVEDWSWRRTARRFKTLARLAAPYKGRTALALGSLLAASLAGLIPPYLAGTLIDRVVRPAQAGTLPLSRAITIAWLAVTAMAAVYLVKQAAARANRDLKLLEPKVAQTVEEAAAEVAAGVHDEQFPIDVFQTGSGTSSNMNANEVIAALASRRLGSAVHPNDHVNMCQSSNDAIPTAIHVSAALTVRQPECAQPKQP